MVDINGCKRAAALLRDAIRADYMLILFDDLDSTVSSSSFLLVSS
jgi:hypothetical protein